MRNFDILDVKLDAIQKVGKSARTPSQCKMLVDLALPLLDTLIARDRYEDAVNVAATAVAASRITLDPALVERTLARMQAVEELAQAYVALKPFLARLEQEPTDPEANLALGRFRCLRKGDWANGLPILAAGGDAPPAVLAARELGGAASAVELADGWWNLAEGDQEGGRDQLRFHAVRWYAKALPTLDGPAKAMAQSRINGTALDAEQ